MIQIEDWAKSTTFVRVARKDHRCRGGYDGEKRTPCSIPIRAGETYIEYVGESPAYSSGDRYHIDCARQQGIIV